MKLDKWQEEIIGTKGNICLRSGRQVGKSTVISHKVGIYATSHKNKNVMVISAVERQAYLLFEKILFYLEQNHKKMIMKGKDRPTRSKLKLTNGTVIHCLPTGLSGMGIRGYTIDLLIADEAAFIPEAVWDAVTPMLIMTGGDTILLSTPFGKGTYFHDAFQRDNYTAFHKTTEEVIREREISDEWTEAIRDTNLINLEHEKKTKTKLAFAQEYLGEFVDELMQLFPTKVIESCMTLQRGFQTQTSFSSLDSNYLGVDVARMGGDETVLFSLKRVGRKKLYEIDLDITSMTKLPETVRRIIKNDAKFNYKRIYIDDGGLGVGVFDALMEKTQTKRKTEAINNSSRSLTHDTNRKKKLLKEDLYTNLLYLMENKMIELVARPETLLSLKSVQYEYTKDGNIKIFGKYTHIAEALIRSAWCMKSKGLNIWCI